MTEPKKQPSRHRSSKLVLLLDQLAHYIITIGGIGTIVAVLFVFFFLVYKVYPLFAPTSSEQEASVSVQVQERPAYVGLDDDKLLIWSIADSGAINLLDAKTGDIITQKHLFDDVKPTALSMSSVHNLIVAGFEDGSIRIATISFEYSFFEKENIEDEYKEMEIGDVKRRGEGVVVKTPARQWRQTSLQIKSDAPLATSRSSSIKRIDFTMSTSGPVVATIGEDNVIEVHTIEEKMSFATMQVTKSLSSRLVDYKLIEKKGAPQEVVLIGQGAYVLLLWQDGYSERYNLLDDEAFLAEKTKLSDGQQITCVGRFIGRNTVLIGYENGNVSAWFLTQPKGAETKDKRVWQEGHVFQGGGSPVAAIASSGRQRLAFIAYKNNRSKLVHVTSERVVFDDVGVEDPLNIAVAPKDDGLILYGEKTIALFSLDAEHPDVTLASLFLPVWYEGYEHPDTTWQSSSASDDAEPKLGLWPLVFGTLKATFYSMLFAIPIAIGAAIYSSEFMTPKVKKTVKPCIEMMASLPSVILGFLGAIIISSYLKEYIVIILASFFIVPVTVAAAAYIIQLLPRDLMVLAMKHRLKIIGVPCMSVGLLFSVWVGNLSESIVFGGDIIKWLEGQGSAFGGIWYLCLPVSIIIILYVISRWVKPALIERLRGRPQSLCATVDIVKFLVSVVATIGLAALMALIFMSLGITFRGGGSVFDNYESRNAMIVGFMMAFAIIPIIYTIADDALSTVPKHLRAASLGSGATPWQTSIRIVVPTAMSGLFSAVMVGLGRAIGETMIVLMAAGNTPILDLNIFSGLKTLSANIASELPEAVKDSTHMRTLFLSALVLFILTFILNTVAEQVRNRFRKKAGSL